jgi:hypothetical protein
MPTFGMAQMPPSPDIVTDPKPRPGPVFVFDTVDLPSAAGLIVSGVPTGPDAGYSTREPLLSDDGKVFLQIAIDRSSASTAGTKSYPRYVVRAIDLSSGTSRDVYRTPADRAASCTDPGDVQWPFATISPDGGRALFHIQEFEPITADTCVARRDEIALLDLKTSVATPVVVPGSRNAAASSSLDVVAWIESPTAGSPDPRVCTVRSGVRTCKSVNDPSLGTGGPATDASVALAGDGSVLLLGRGRRGALEARLLQPDSLTPLGDASDTFRGPATLAAGECAIRECGQLMLSHVGSEAGYFLLGKDVATDGGYGRAVLIGLGGDGKRVIIDPVLDVLGRPESGYRLGDLWALLRAPSLYSAADFNRSAAMNFGLPAPALAIVPVPSGLTPGPFEEIGDFCRRYNALCASLNAIVVRGDLAVVAWGVGDAFGTLALAHLSWDRRLDGNPIGRRLEMEGSAVLSVSRNGRHVATVDLARPTSRILVYDALAFPVTKFNPIVVDPPPTEAACCGGGEMGCFIATAVYGDSEHPDVLRLRRFRDDVLSVSEVGRAFVRNYYLFSPPAARFVERNQWLRPPLAMVLGAVVVVVEQPRWALVVVLVVPAGLLIGRLRRRPSHASDRLDAMPVGSHR